MIPPDLTGRMDVAGPATETAAASGLEQAKIFTDLRRRLATLQKEILSLPADGIGRALHRQQIIKAFFDIGSVLKFAAPFAPCPYGLNCQAGKCRACLGSKWITKAVYDALPKELQ